MAKYHLYIRAIPGYPSYYATVEGDILKKRGKSFYKLTPTPVHNGYYTVKIIHRVKVHRLIALAFIPNPNNYPIVCHKDNNPTNNKPENLYWGTQSHNMQQMVRDGRQRKSKIVKQILNLTVGTTSTGTVCNLLFHTTFHGYVVIPVNTTHSFKL